MNQFSWAWLGMILFCPLVVVHGYRGGEELLLAPRGIVKTDKPVRLLPTASSDVGIVKEGTPVFVLDRWTGSHTQEDSNVYFLVFNSSGVFGWVEAVALSPHDVSLTADEIFLLERLDHDLVHSYNEKKELALKAWSELSQSARDVYLAALVNDLICLRNNIHSKIRVLGPEKTLFVDPILHCISNVEWFGSRKDFMVNDYMNLLRFVAPDKWIVRQKVGFWLRDTNERFPIRLQDIQ